MVDLNGFNANEEEPAGDFSPIPSGKYECVIIESERVRTKADDGSFLKLTFEVTAGDFKGRRLWANLNTENPSAKAVQIAKGQLSAICRAVGVMEPKDSQELHDLPLMVSVRKTTSDEYGEQNKVTGFSAVERPTDTSAITDTSTTKPTKAPWSRGAKAKA